MSYWFGCRVVEFKAGSKPGRWVLEGPYASAQEAETAKLDAREPDMKVSAVVIADSTSEATRLLEAEPT